VNVNTPVYEAGAWAAGISTWRVISCAYSESHMPVLETKTTTLFKGVPGLHVEVRLVPVPIQSVPV